MEQIYYYTAPATITCDSCRNIAAGDQVDIALRTDLLPALPDSIRGIVQLVTDLIPVLDPVLYTIQYDDADLLGVIPALTDEFVDTVTCVSELILAQEYSDARDDLQDIEIAAIEASLAGLGVVPADGDNQFVVHPDSEAGVSVESLKHEKVTVAISGIETIILDPTDLASPLAISDLTGMSYRIDVDVSAISDEVTDNHDSAAQFLLVGQFDAGATTQTLSLVEKDGVTIVAVKVGNNFHISLTNPSTVGITMFVTSKFRILS